MRRLDSSALFAALNQQRVARGLTWNEVARQTGVAVSTIKRVESGGRMEVDGMLNLVSWLGVPVETFVRSTEE